MKTTILTILLLAGLCCTAFAQQKYEYAHVQYLTNMGGKLDGIYVCITGKPAEKIEVTKPLKINAFTDDYTPLLEYIQTMTDKGWEIISTSKTRNDVYDTFYLKRKRD